jgi:hypothetical protein
VTGLQVDDFGFEEARSLTRRAMTSVRGQLRGRLTARLVRSTGVGSIPAVAADPATDSCSHRTRVDSGSGSKSALSGTWTAWRTATAEVSGRVRSRTALVPAWAACEAMPAGHRPSAPPLEVAVACGSSGPGLRPGRAPHELPCPQGYRRGPPLSTLVAGVRSAGRTSVRGVRSPSTPAWPLTPAWPPVPDTSRPEDGCSGSSGRSIRRSFRLVSASLLKAGAAGGRPRVGSTWLGSGTGFGAAAEPRRLTGSTPPSLEHPQPYRLVRPPHTPASSLRLSGHGVPAGRVPWSGGIEGVVVNLSDGAGLVARERRAWRLPSSPPWVWLDHPRSG